MSSENAHPSLCAHLHPTISASVGHPPGGGPDVVFLAMSCPDCGAPAKFLGVECFTVDMIGVRRPDNLAVPIGSPDGCQALMPIEWLAPPARGIASLEHTFQ